MFAARRLLSSAALTLALTGSIAGCDSDVTSRAAELDGELEGEAGPHGRKGPHGPGHARGPHGGPGRMLGMLSKVCEQVSCSEDQRTELEGIAAGLQPDEAARAKHQAQAKAHHEKLADAFEADPFDADAVAEVKVEKKAVRAAKTVQMTKALAKAHGVFSAEQRSQLAGMVETFGPMMLGGPRGPGKPGGGDASKWRDKKAERGAARLCETVECTADQEQQIAAALADAMGTGDAPGQAERDAMRDSIVAALQAETLGGARATALIEKFHALQEARHPDGLAVLDELHGILSP